LSFDEDAFFKKDLLASEIEKEESKSLSLGDPPNVLCKTQKASSDECQQSDDSVENGIRNFLSQAEEDPLPPTFQTLHHAYSHQEEDLLFDMESCMEEVVESPPVLIFKYRKHRLY
jgi:hypothetical protein